MTVSLITTDQVASRLGRALTDVETARLPFIAADVSATIRGYTGQTITQQVHVSRVLVLDGAFRLPERPVVSVASIATVDGTAVTGWGWDGLEMVEWVTAPVTLVSTPSRLWVDVTYTAGWEEVPDAIVGVGCAIAVRALTVQPDSVALQSESIGGYSYQRGGAAANGSFGLLLGERQILDRYRRTAATLGLRL